MIEYREFRPTSFDSRGLALYDQQHWLVHPCSHTRDSGIRTESNFSVALADLGGESETVEVHRFGHWGPGWFEIIVIDPSDEERVRIANDHESSLDNYPVLSDEDCSSREYEAVMDYWKYMSLIERIELCAKHEVSIFAARHDYPPSGESDPDGSVYDEIERCVST